MLFLVSGEWVEVGGLLPPQQVASLIEYAVVPSLKIWTEWEEQGRIKGGIFAGE